MVVEGGGGLVHKGKKEKCLKMLKMAFCAFKIFHDNRYDMEFSICFVVIFFESFPNDMLFTGSKIEHFDFPICNSFKAKIIEDQLCYEVDPNKYKDKMKKLSISLLIFVSRTVLD